VQPNEIGVSVKDGVVTLTGVVDSLMKKWAAEQAALRIRGVRPEARPTDADIARAAVRRLEFDGLVPDDRIKVTVSKGIVTLRGEVEWNHQRRAAEQVIRRLRGVLGVNNLVAVRPRTTPEDLRRRIADALTRSAATDARNHPGDVPDRWRRRPGWPHRVARGR
jgi:osmotically-inducible protein OsmY